MIYRIIRWEDGGSRRFLTDNEMFFYSAKQWENDGEFNFELENFTVSELTDVILDIAIDMHNNRKVDYAQWMEDSAAKFGIDLNLLQSHELDIADQTFAHRHAVERSLHPEDFQLWLKQLYFERFGIFCFTTDKWSYPLWTQKRNGGDDNVFCVGIDENVLLGVLNQHSNIFVGTVTYDDVGEKFKLMFDKTGITHLVQLASISFNLKQKFFTESEFRVQRLFATNDLNDPSRKIVLPNEAFKEIIIFEDADYNIKASIRELANEKGVERILNSKVKDDSGHVEIY